ncbi:hypothetical protein AQUCO_01100460v1 [Aquilegia coerulea]|uniref:Uncharacterized protein n=1 Tax=Aquilegia coerulea TaxID=218851 RepID=A0A2G5E7S7_AQUCA|nr:hypothetical protein AQUCO_01100460v1 [Aquilegia coerulea]
MCIYSVDGRFLHCLHFPMLLNTTGQGWTKNVNIFRIDSTMETIYTNLCSNINKISGSIYVVPLIKYSPTYTTWH